MLGIRNQTPGHPRCDTPGLRWTLLALAALAVVSSTAHADDDFTRHVQPILVRHCLDCHSAEEPELKLSLDSATAVVRGSETGPVITAGKPDESLLVQVLAKGAKPHMPPDGQLSDEEIAAVSNWIKSLDPAAVGVSRLTDEDRSHWAFQPVVEPELPSVEDTDWPRTPVDRFILAALEREGIAPSPPADRATLLRRLWFDLVGLPPTPEDIERFLADDAPDAYEREVDRLLASPHYGERWGRHWLDLARYADTGGFHNDLDRPNAWRYRDYVIASLNADKPYPQFVREQLAGDELPDANAESWIATAFGRHGPSNEQNMGNGLDRERYRLDELHDVVSTVSGVFLGLTLGCARCHDHKYDPLSQRDYYSFLAVFNSVEKQDLALEAFAPGEPQLTIITPKNKVTVPAAMVLSDRGQKPRTTRILWRGDLLKPGPHVEPAIPEVLSRTSSGTFEVPPETSTPIGPLGRRTVLAEWIVSDDNPLTWRVIVNRLWHHHFGRGLVESPSNFGRLAEPPSHPELLDWLAVELRRSGGSLKSLHRTLVTSAVYRQSSRAEGSGLTADPDNRLLWRMNKRRLEAEPLRDAFLAVAGNLNPEVGGPGIKPRIRPR